MHDAPFRRAILAASLGVCVAATLGPTTGRAAEAPAVTFTAIDPAGFFDASTFVLGWRFTANADLLVTSLGQFDAGGDGLGGNADVALYTLDGTELVRTTVGSGTGPELEGAFRYARVTPTLLRAGSDYVIASFLADQALDVSTGPASVFSANPAVTVVEDRFAFGGSLAFPAGVDGGVPAWFGPSFRFVPVSTLSLSGSYGDDDGFGVGETEGTLSEPTVSHPSPGEAPFTDLRLIGDQFAEPAFAPTDDLTLALPAGGYVVEGLLTLRTGSWVSGPNPVDDTNVLVLDGIPLDPAFLQGFTQTGNEIEEHDVSLPGPILDALQDGAASLAGTHLSENSGSGRFQVDFLRLDAAAVAGPTATTAFYGDDDGFGVGETEGTLSEPTVSHPSPGEAPLTDVRLIGDQFSEPAFAPTDELTFTLPADAVVVGARLTLRAGSWVSGPSPVDTTNVLVLDGIPLDPAFLEGFTQTGNEIEEHSVGLPGPILGALQDGAASLAGTHLSENGGSGSFQVDFLRLDVVSVPEPPTPAAPALAALSLLALRAARRRGRAEGSARA